MLRRRRRHRQIKTHLVVVFEARQTGVGGPTAVVLALRMAPRLHKIARKEVFLSLNLTLQAVKVLRLSPPVRPNRLTAGQIASYP